MEKQTNNKIDHKIVQYKKKRRFNLVSLIFFLILIYMGAQFWISSGRETIRVFTLETAQESTLLHEYRGVITRDERIMTTIDSGYINYCVREGRRVGVKSPVYIIDESGEFSEILKERYHAGIYLSDEMQTELKKKLGSASLKGESGDFQSVYRNKADLSATVADAFLYTAMLGLDEEKEELAEGETAAAESEWDKLIKNMESVSTDQSGYIMFRTDSLDGMIPENVTKDTFDETRVSASVYISGEHRRAGEFAYKLIKDDSFCITFQISEEDAKRYRDKKYLGIELISLGVTVNGAFSIFTADDGTMLATISLKKYGSEYLSERFVDFKIIESSVNGYKIPVTSVFTRDFLVIPRNYLTRGGENKKTYGVYKENYDLKEKEEFVPVSIYAETDVYYYIASSKLKLGDYLIEKKDGQTESGNENTVSSVPDRYLLSVTAPLYGVYNVNKGYCIFRQVEIINTTVDGNYYMIKTGTRYGLSPYDRIIHDADTVVESQIIY